eukprot:TRINITY_DN69820_c0_g1_i1.p1 TRINITY_DN69820_c0_g1~~TRINITY_DN69820_c0_g1_i1.p1  ORF type:complete len:1236 (-),score=255.98 TRINITY_DN69820_c0_g1_i1:218-3925(-)
MLSHPSASVPPSRLAVAGVPQFPPQTITLEAFVDGVQASAGRPLSASLLTPPPPPGGAGEDAAFSLQRLLKTVLLIPNGGSRGVRHKTPGPALRTLSDLIDNVRHASGVSPSGSAQRWGSARSNFEGSSRTILDSFAARQSIIRSPAWTSLHELIGDACMVVLLTDYVVFQQVAPKRWLQVSGQRLTDDLASLLGWRVHTTPGGSGVKAPAAAAAPERRPSKRERRAAKKKRKRLQAKPGKRQRVEEFRPSQALIPRQRIFFAPRWSASGGFPQRHPLMQLPTTQRGARVLARWILSSSLKLPRAPRLDLPAASKATPPRGAGEVQPQRPVAAAVGRPAEPKLPRGRRKAHRGQRRRKKKCQPKEGDLRQHTKHSGQLLPAPSCRHLLVPLQTLLTKACAVDYVRLLDKHCPSSAAVRQVAEFEGRGGNAAQRPVFGRSCFCGAGAESRERGAAGRSSEMVCAGGEAELRFMRGFPAMSCALRSRQVSRFVLAALQELLGPEAGALLLGCQKNWTRFLKNVEAFVELPRGETLSIHDAMQGMARSSFAKNVCSSLSKKRFGQQNATATKFTHLDHLMARVLYFLFAHIVVPLLREHFYATDTEAIGTRTVYFRKNVWHLIASRADCAYMHLCLGDASTEAAAGAVAEPGAARHRKRTARAAGSRPMQLPKLRWVPKGKGLRPIQQGSNIMAEDARDGQAASQRDALRVLGHARAALPELLGRSLLSQVEVYKPLLADFKRLKRLSAKAAEEEEEAAPGREPFFVAVADLKNCFERIDHSSLVRRLAQFSLQLDKTYRIENVGVRQVSGPQRPQDSRTGEMNGGGDASGGPNLRSSANGAKALQVAIPMGGSGDDRSLATLLASARCPAGVRQTGLLICPGFLRLVRGDLAIATTIAALSGHRLLLSTQRGARFWRRGAGACRSSADGTPQGAFRLLRGIPQGLSLSPLLCGLHMGGGDNKMLAAALPAAKGFMLRLVDDFLIVSRVKENVLRFLRQLRDPDNPYGGELNERKVATSFDVARGRKRLREAMPAPACPEEAAGRLVPWAGLTLTPTRTQLNISAQSSRGSSSIVDTLAIPSRQGVSEVARASKSRWHVAVHFKLRAYLNVKLTVLLLDPELNSEACIRGNVARVCSTCALRLLSMVLRRAGGFKVPAAAVSAAAVDMARHAARLVVVRTPRPPVEGGLQAAAGAGDGGGGEPQNRDQGDDADAPGAKIRRAQAKQHQHTYDLLRPPP